ncbi:putative ribosomal protein S5/S7 [Helianthus anomalus]
MNQHKWTTKMTVNFLVYYYDRRLVIVYLPCCSGPREDATRIGSTGVVNRQAVDISPLRRVNQAIYLFTTGARESAFRNVKPLLSALLMS